MSKVEEVKLDPAVANAFQGLPGVGTVAIKDEHPKKPEEKDEKRALTKVKTMERLTKRDLDGFPDRVQGLYKLAEAMVGALGQGDVSAIWNPSIDVTDTDWSRYIDPKFQDCIYTALADLAMVSKANIWQVVADPMPRTHFLAYIKYEYSTTKLATKGTYRQLDAKSDLANGFRRAADFFRTWRKFGVT